MSTTPAPYAARTPEPLYPRLRRSRSLRVVAGVAAGLAQHLGIPVLWVRVFFVVASFSGGLGPLLYAGLWMLTPLEPKDEAETEAPGAERRNAVNIALVAVGFIGALVALQVTSGAGGTVVFILGVLIVGAVIALQAYDRGTGTAANYAALALGVVLVMGGVLAIALLGENAGITGVVVSVLVTVFGVAVLVVPLIAKLASSLVAEREAKAVADQRAEIASRLHDSVLQTLALIQKQADDPEEVARLARGQERELRAWLFDAADKPTGAGATTVFAAVQKAAGEVEDRYGVVIGPVTVGQDAPFDAETEPLVLAAREAMVNAAKHAGVERIDVYAEHIAGSLTVFVRDRGTGFDLDTVPEDRHGVRDSIVGRMERAGGQARITTAPGAGTEVELSVPTPSR
ncbi:PspC domain-containing protein [Corynebacterium sp. TA-R-1]|uniref:PspC domain-containing protein n=1 Tax=Corynebacterium stercoris TaxID=2943490 RepID=A0ABT1G190_9CORY|nr:ATP-binding protein [Corynebacterium stercoris]MCP1387794.1 PspC domain-containing protein [Corynebacterium stercoris]